VVGDKSSDELIILNRENKQETREKAKFKMNGKNRADVLIGASVKVVLKADQRSGKLTEGTVQKILTNSSFHPHGIKVMLQDGQVGRVQEITGEKQNESTK
jgi:conserved hypothetical protein